MHTPLCPSPADLRPARARRAAAARPDSSTPLARFPEVRRRLRARGVRLARSTGEAEVAHAERLATALMSLYRDTRDPGVFEALYALTHAGLRAWIQRMVQALHCPRDPEELVQDTYVNVYRYSARFRSDHPASFRAWVRTIGANAVKRASDTRARASLQGLPEGLQEPSDPRFGPAGQVIAREEAGRLGSAWLVLLACYGAAFAELGERDQRALRAVEVEGHSYASVARSLGVGASNMKMIVFRARRRLLARLNGRLGGSRNRAA